MAIAFDAASDNGGLVNSTSVTSSHTCSGSNRILFAGFFGNTSDTVTGVTYNGTAMTLVDKVLNVTDRWIYVYMLVNPDLGTHDIVASGSSSFWRLLGVSYTGAAQSAQPDSHAKNSATGVSTLTTTTTVVAANCWAILLGKTDMNDPAASTGSTQRELGDGNGIGIYDSNGTLSTGSNSMTFTNSPSGDDAGIIVSFSPFTGGATVFQQTAMTMGLGM